MNAFFAGPFLSHAYASKDSKFLQDLVNKLDQDRGKSVTITVLSITDSLSDPDVRCFMICLSSEFLRVPPATEESRGLLKVVLSAFRFKLFFSITNARLIDHAEK